MTLADSGGSRWTWQIYKAEHPTPGGRPVMWVVHKSRAEIDDANVFEATQRDGLQTLPNLADALTLLHWDQAAVWNQMEILSRGVPYAFWRVTRDSGATLDGVPEVRAGVPFLP